MKNKLIYLKNAGFILLVLSITLFANPLQAQVRNSENGYSLPVKGRLNVLVVFADIDHTIGCDTCINPDPSTQWPPLQIPSFAGDLFDTVIAPGAKPTKIMSDLFYQASFGQYIVTGDYYPEPVIISEDEDGGTGVDAVLEKLDNVPTPITTASGQTLDDFDLYTNRKATDQELHGREKSPVSNGRIDVILIVWRHDHPYGVQEFGTFNTKRVQLPL